MLRLVSHPVLDWTVDARLSLRVKLNRTGKVAEWVTPKKPKRHGPKKMGAKKMGGNRLGEKPPWVYSKPMSLLGGQGRFVIQAVVDYKGSPDGDQAPCICLGKCDSDHQRGILSGLRSHHCCCLI